MKKMFGYKHLQNILVCYSVYDNVLTLRIYFLLLCDIKFFSLLVIHTSDTLWHACESKHAFITYG